MSRILDPSVLASSLTDPTVIVGGLLIVGAISLAGVLVALLDHLADRAAAGYCEHDVPRRLVCIDCRTAHLVWEAGKLDDWRDRFPLDDEGESMPGGAA